MRRVIRNSNREGSKKTKFFKYEPKRDGKVHTKTLSGRGMDIFWINTLICSSVKLSGSINLWYLFYYFAGYRLFGIKRLFRI